MEQIWFSFKYLYLISLNNVDKNILIPKKQQKVLLYCEPAYSLQINIQHLFTLLPGIYKNLNLWKIHTIQRKFAYQQQKQKNQIKKSIRRRKNETLCWANERKYVELLFDL